VFKAYQSVSVQLTALKNSSWKWSTLTSSGHAELWPNTRWHLITVHSC